MLEELTIFFAYASFTSITLCGHVLLLNAIWPRPKSEGRQGAPDVSLA
jgi:hypothetical protein